MGTLPETEATFSGGANTLHVMDPLVYDLETAVRKQTWVSSGQAPDVPVVIYYL